MSFPPNLLYHLDRLQGFSTSQVLLQPQNKNSATSSDVIQLQIPSNTIFNFRSLKMHFNFQTSGTNLVRAPENVASFIERIEVNMGGNILNPGSNFINVFTNAKRAVMSDQTQNIGDSCLSHPRMVRNVSYVDGATISSSETYVAGTNGLNTGETCFALEQFEGFISSIQPYLFSTDLVPQISIRLYLASNNILSVSSTAALGKASGNFADSAGTISTNNQGLPATNITANGTYTLSDIVFTAEVINLADATYDNMIASMMNEQGFLECPFKNYNSFIDTFTGTSRFSTATSSLDRVWIVFRSSDYNTQNPPITIEGYKKEGGFIGPLVTSTTTTLAVGVSQFDIGGTIFDGGEERYNSRYFNFSEPVLYTAPGSNYGGWKGQLSINGMMYPNFNATLPQWYGITRNSLPANAKHTRISLRQYRKNFCVLCARFCMPESDGMRLMSGIDLRGSNMSGFFTTNGTTSLTCAINLFSEETATLRIGMGRSVEIVS